MMETQLRSITNAEIQGGVYRQTTRNNQEVAFIDFLFKNTVNKKYLWGILVSMMLQFVVFKFFYPFADFSTDSYNYIYAAAKRIDFCTWPVGYSKFLYIVHWFTHSDTALVAFQYAMITGVFLIFFFSLLYWYRPGTVIVNIIFVFLFLNPLFLYLSNNILSDSLFLVLSLLWLTQLLWMIHCPRSWHIWSHGILLAMAFTVRYYAFYYPLIALVAFLFSDLTVRGKIAGILFPLVLIGMFVLYTREKAWQMTGVRQFSLFSGWQWANNALYMFPHIQVDSTKLPPESLALHRIVRNYFDTAPLEQKLVTPVYGSYSYYMWDNKSPMKQYLKYHVEQSGQPYKKITSWAEVAPVFRAYGIHLINQHPGAYVRYYLLPNAANYFVPPLEKLQIYNNGEAHLSDPIAKEWFDYKNMEVRAASEDFQGSLLFFFPTLFLLVNVAFLVSIIYTLVNKTYKERGKHFLTIVLLMGTFFLVNMGFSISSAPIFFRYQVFPLVVFTAFGLLLSEPFLREALKD